MRLPKKNVGEDYGMRSMALLLSATVALSVVTPLAVVFGLNAMTQPTSVGGFPDVPDYEGLLVTLPSEGEEIQACQAGELVTQLPIDEIRRYLPLEEQQDFLNKHPRSYWPRTYYPPEVYTIGFGVAESDFVLLTADESGVRTPAPRDIEEADIVRLVGDTYFILNPYRGLLIVDVASPDEPQLLGRARVYGEPVEMFVVDSMAYLVVRADYGYWNALLTLESVREVCDFNIGSRIVVVDVSDLANPEIVEKFRVPGFVQDTRRVGNVIYAVSNEYAWDGRPSEDENVVHVVSFDISDPANITEIQTIDFEGSYNQIHITERAIFVAQPTSRDDPDGFPKTNIVYVDISHPGGLMTVRGSYEVGGWLGNRYQMDYYDGTFRLVTHYWRGMGESELWILDVSDPSDISLSGRLLIDDAGTLMATRFAGERAYTIHLPRRVDPLDVLDLSDPTEPKLTDVLEIPGWITHMEVRGYRILALGVDDTSGWNVALSLFDVSDPYNAVLLDRVKVGEGWSRSSANTDPKTLSVLDDLEMVLVPFTSHFEDENGLYRSANAIQLVDFDLSSGELTTRGIVNTPASVSRTRHHAERILATSDRTLQIIDFADRDSPEVTAVVELATHILDYVRVGDHFVRLVQHDAYSTLRLETVSGSAGTLAAMDTGLSYGSLLVEEPYVYIIGYGYGSREQKIKIFDYTDPANPEFRGEYALSDGSDPCGNFLTLCYDYISYYGSEYVPALEDGYFVYYHPSRGLQFDSHGYTLYVVDLSRPSNPSLASTLEFNAHMMVNALIEDDVLYFTDVEYSYEADGLGNIESETQDRLGRISLARLDHPVQLPSVSIPGVMVDVEGDRVYTLAGYDYEEFQTLNVLEVENDEATVLLAVEVEGYVGRVVIEDGIAFIGNHTGYRYWRDYASSKSYFTVMDLRDVDDPTITGVFEIAEYASPWNVEGGYAFLSSSSGCIYIFDVSGAEPSFFGIHLSNSRVMHIRVYGSQVYFVEGYYGVEVVDLSGGK